MTDIVEDGNTGLLVEADDADAHAEAICRLLSDAGLARPMGKARRKRVLDRSSY